MRLAILIYSLSGGGAERVVSYLLAHCVTNNIEVHLVLMNNTIEFELPNTITPHYIETSKHDESGVMKAIKIPLLANRYSKLIKKLKVTHSLSFLTRPSFINVLASKITSHQYKVIVNERAFPSLQYSYTGFQSTFNKALIKLLYKKADLVISNSHGNAQDLLDNFEVSPSKMRVIHNPIDLEKINVIELKQSFFDSDKFNIITVGRLDEGKNHELLIRAIQKLQNPSLRLYIFGFGHLEDYLKRLAEQLQIQNQIIFMGFDPNPYPYLKAADLFIFGSNHEGFPNVILEAMACGLPILTTNCQSGPREIMALKNATEGLMVTDYGILVPVNNIKLMSDGINYFLDNPDYAKSCRMNSEKRIEDFEKERILNEYINLIISIN